MKRRRVVRVAVVYGAVACAVLQAVAANAAMDDALAVFTRVPDAFDLGIANHRAAKVAITSGGREAALSRR